MLVILYPIGLNWFYEAVARNAHEDLTALGLDVRLITAPELMATPPQALGRGSDIIIVNFYESAQWMVTPGFAGYCDIQLEQLRNRISSFDRRILLNLDSIYTHWFSTNMRSCQSVLTDIFDLTMLPQTDAKMLAGARYTWIPESLTRREICQLPRHDDNRTFPWAIIGHATPERAVIAEELARLLGPGGFLFLLGLRPSRGEGGRNLLEHDLDRVLSGTRFYVWSSHHGFPYHEGLRALHAIRNGAIPVKLEKAFAIEFAQVPWVYPNVDALLSEIRQRGAQQMYERAAAFVRSRGTLGEQIAKAMGIDSKTQERLSPLPSTPSPTQPVSLSA